MGDEKAVERAREQLRAAREFIDLAQPAARAMEALDQVLEQLSVEDVKVLKPAEQKMLKAIDAVDQVRSYAEVAMRRAQDALGAIVTARGVL